MKTLLSKWTLISMFKGVDWFNIMKSPVADLHSKILDAPPSRSYFIHFYAVFKFYFTKQYCIPVGCILPALHRVCVWRAGLYLGGLDSKPPNKNPLSETPWTETPLDRTTLDRDPLDRDPLDRDPPGQRPHSEGSWNQKKRPPWKENGTRQPDRKCYHTEPPPQLWTEWHTLLKILPCPLRYYHLRTVIIGLWLPLRLVHTLGNPGPTPGVHHRMGDSVFHSLVSGPLQSSVTCPQSAWKLHVKFY